MRWLAALAALLIAAPAMAGKVLVIRPTTNQVADEGMSQRFHEHYNTMGMDYEVVDERNISANSLKLSNTEPFVEGTHTYVAVIVEGYRAQLSTVLDSLTRQTRAWPSIPVLMIAAGNAQASTIILAQAANCSTGIGNNAAIGANFASMFKERMEYVNGSSPNKAWRTNNAYAGFSLTTLPAGVYRVVLKEGVSPWYDYKKLSQPIKSPPDMDSLIAVPGDTITLVARYRADASGNGTGSPLMFMSAGAWATNSQAAASYDAMRLTCALGMLDSATGGRVLYQTRQGPVTEHIRVSLIGAAGKYNKIAPSGTRVDIDHDFGIFAASDSDSVAVKATMVAMQAAGVRATANVQMDSAAAYPRQLAWLRDLWPLCHVAPMERAGVDSFVDTGNSSVAVPQDLFGATRHRGLFPSGCTDPRLGCSDCTTDTGSVYCGIRRDYAALAAYFGSDRLDWVAQPAYTDYTPKYFTRSIGSRDSMMWAFKLAGLKGVLVGVMAQSNSSSSLGPVGGVGAPRGDFPNMDGRSVVDPSTNLALGNFWFIAYRSPDYAAIAWADLNNHHDDMGEQLGGLFTTHWYNGTSQGGPIYVNKHNFFTRMPAIGIRADWLGGTGAAANQNYRPGYWIMKGLDDFVDTANSLAGRQIVRLGYGEDVIDWLERSGIR